MIARAPSPQRGYTLIEVIVAFALLAVGIGILLSILASGVRQVSSASQTTHASLYADSLLSTLGADARLQQSQRRGAFENGKYHWVMQILKVPTPIPPPTAAAADPAFPVRPDLDALNFRENELYRITLDMRWGDAPDQRLLVETLRAYAPGPELQR